MAPPLYGDDVEYADGTETDLEQQCLEDVAAFLMWTAEPKMMARYPLHVHPTHATARALICALAHGRAVRAAGVPGRGE